MKKNLLAILFGAFMITSAIAQKSLFSPGYVVVNKDTLSGFVERQDELQMSKNIRFRKDMQSEETTYSAFEASAFGFDTDHVKFEIVTADLRKVNEVTTVTRFAKLLLSGFTNLYKLQVPDDERFVAFEHDNRHIYIVKKNNNFFTLGMYEFVNDKSVGINRNYRDVLKYKVFTDCPQVLANIDKLEFDDKSIVKAVNGYNHCRQPEITSVEHHYSVEKIVRHGVNAGYVHIPVHDAFMTDPSGFTIGYFCDIINPDISQSISLRLAPNYVYVTATDRINKLHLFTGSIHYIRCPIVAQVNFNKATHAKVVPYVAIGPVLSVALKNETRLSNSFMSAHLEAGTYFGRCVASAFVDNPGIISFTDGYSLNIMVGYRFDK